MTLEVDTTRILYSGTGSTGPFAVPFLFSVNSHVKVARQAASGTITELAEGDDYTLSGGPDAGMVTLSTALAAASGSNPAERLAIWRKRPLTQEVDLSVNDPYRSTIIEGALDTLTQIDQELSERIDRAISLPVTDSVGATTELPAASQRANKLLGFNASGGVAVVDPATVGSGGGGDLGVTAIIDGGTGASTATEARSNLGIGAIGTKETLANTDIATAHATLNHSTIITTYLEANSSARLQSLGQWVVESATTTAPASVVNGTAYLIPTGSTGVWAAQVGKIAYGAGGVWTYKTPAKGWTAFARDTDAEWYYDGTAWAQTSGTGSSSSTPTYSSQDARVAGYAKTNGGGGGKWRAHWTNDQRIVVYGDNANFVYEPTGDNWGPFELSVPWDTSTISIENMYAGQNYLLVQTNESTGNLYHIGSSASGQGGNGSTSAVTQLTKITKFTTDAVKIASVKTEASRGTSSGFFWYALTTAGNVYSCGYGLNYLMGNNSTSNLSTPRKITQSDGVTAIASVTEIVCDTPYAPVFLITSDHKAWRFGSGTDGAHGGGSTSNLTWPTLLETTVGSGVARTDISTAVVTGDYVSTQRSAAWLLTTAGKVECAGNRTYGNGDGAALLSAASTTFQAASGTISTLTITAIAAGGGENYVCVAISSAGNGYICGYMASYGFLGNGGITNLNVFTIFSSLPSGFAGALTGAKISGGNSFSVVYLEALISGVKRLASIGYDTSYATSKGTVLGAAANQTWGSVLGARGTILSWQAVGDSQVHGLEVLNSDGELRYAGGNDQGQAGVQPGNLRSVAYLQPCRLSGPRLLKPLTWKGAYSAGTTYTQNDLAGDQGSTWLLIVPTSTGVAPPTLPTTSNSSWFLVAQKGDAGFANIVFDFDGGTTALTSGMKARIPVSFSCTITEATLVSDTTGSIVLDVWKNTYANYPPTVADTITASAKPTLSSASKTTDATLTGWTKTITAGDILIANINSVSGITNAVLTLKAQRS